MIARLLGFLLAILFVLSVAHAPDHSVSGIPESIHDGDTLRIAGTRIRLAGLDAPELKQDCRRPDGISYPAGLVARDRLRELAEGKAITCMLQGTDRYGRSVGTCGEINRTLVHDGMAVAAYGAQFRREEAQARLDRAGIWNGECEAPAQWRRERR